MNALKIYKSSAGSGKTYALVKEYLRILLLNPSDYRHTLAITFTNKATAEMKSRILNALVDLAAGKESELKKSLEKELDLKDLDTRAKKSLDLILHDYSSFSINTIDSFFQKIIRGLAREINLPVNTQLQLNHEEVKEEITDRLFEEIGKDEQLTKWMTELIEQKLLRDGRWDIHQDLMTIAGELFNARHAEIKTFDKEQIKKFYKELQTIRNAFESSLQEKGKKALKIIADAGVTVDDFSSKARGPAGYFIRIAAAKIDADKIEPSATILAAATDPAKWITKTSALKETLRPLVENILMPILMEALQEVEENYSRYLSAITVLRRIYLLGILNDLSKKLAQYRQEKNLLLLSDTPRILNRFIRESDTSFVFEKTGSHYKHFLIDEFQDTSGIQWKNLLPLIVNSLGSGNFSMVVGDAKQSIYRWRGGDIKLLGGTLKDDLRHFSSIIKEEKLDTNYRSRRDVVDFNNSFFSSVPSVIRNAYEDEDSAVLQNFYSDGLHQKTAPANEAPGFVNIRFLEKEKAQEREEGEDEPESLKWKDSALLQMLETIHRLIDHGYAYGDIAVLVRKNDEGNAAANFLSAHGVTQVVSSDSLLIKNNPKIIFLINAFRFIADPGNHIARSELLFSYCSLIDPAATEQSLHPLFTDFAAVKSRRGSGGAAPGLFSTSAYEKNLFNQLLPPEFTGHLPYLSKLPVYEAAEQLTRIFKLDNPPEAYVERFLDLVLEFSSRHHSGIQNFIRWWDESSQARSCSVVIPEAGNAIRILTIHKAKGLQFPVVLMPFCEWDFFPSKDSLIWVHSEQDPFAAFGELPLPPVQSLSKTVFNKSYGDEIIHSLTDNINLLYVAFTRAEQQLVAWCPAAPASGIKKCSAFIERVLTGNESLQQLYSTETMELIIGDAGLRQVRRQTDPGIPVQTRTDFHKTAWQDKLTIAARAREYSDDAESKKSAVSRGILVHKILSQTEDASRLDKTLARFLFEGLITPEEKNTLFEEISRILNDVQVQEFFLPGKKIFSERDILLPDGELFRPDRVLIEGQKAAVLDFKTGEESESHRNQLKEYEAILHQMGYAPVQSYLVYLKSGRVKQVV